MVSDNQSNPLVSVLIPNYNHGAYIGEAIESALGQSYPNLEIIVTDNCSTDNSREVIDAYANKDCRIKCKYHSTNIGAIRNWRSALDMAEGEYCKILFSDDLIDSAFISSGIEILKDEDIGFYYSAVQSFGANQTTYFDGGTSGLKDTRDFIKKHCCYIEKLPVSPGCALFRLDDVRRSLFEKIHTPTGVDPCEHGYGADLLLFLDVAHRYEKFFFDNRYLSHFRAHADSITVSNQSNRMGNAKHHLFYLLTRAYFLSSNSGYEDLLPSFNAICSLILTLYKKNDLGIDRMSSVMPNHLSRLQYYPWLPVSCLRLLRAKISK